MMKAHLVPTQMSMYLIRSLWVPLQVKHLREGERRLRSTVEFLSEEGLPYQGKFKNEFGATFSDEISGEVQEKPKQAKFLQERGF